MLQLLIVDDSKWTREGLAQVIDWASLNIEIAGTCANAVNACEVLASKHIDILITDIRMAGMDGLELAEHVHYNYPHIKIILISAYREFDYAYKAVHLGVSGYVLKPIDSAEMLKTVQSILPDPPQANAAPVLEDTSASSVEKIVSSAKKYIDQYIYDPDMSLADIADELHINYYYLSKCFKKGEGISFSKYVTNKRLQMASELLSNTNLHIYEICKQIGLDPKNFHVLFRKEYNQTPQEYRKNHNQSKTREEL